MSIDWLRKWLVPDGALVDLQMPGLDAEGQRRVWRWIQEPRFGASLRVDGDEVPFVAELAAAMEVAKAHSVVATVEGGGDGARASLNLYVFAEQYGLGELDFDPRAYESDAALRWLLGFMGELGRVAGTAVEMAWEGEEEAPFLRWGDGGFVKVREA